MVTANRIAAAGAAVAGVAVALGAFGTHGLRDVLAPERLVTYETAARYAMYHGLGLVGVGLAAAMWPARAARLQWAAYLFGAGLVLFCGSLWMIVATDVRAFGAVAPLGGISLMAGWAVFAVTLARKT